MQYEDFHLGLDTKYDFKKVKSLLAQAAYSHCGLYYAQFDILKNAFILGSSFTIVAFSKNLVVGVRIARAVKKV